MQITINGYPFTDEIRSQSGVYVMVTYDSAGSWTILYVGESQDVQARLSNHEKVPCWQRHNQGRLQPFAYYCDATARVRIEREIYNQYQPVCNR